MDDLLRAMQLLDKHSDKLPEGDYLEICNNLMRSYNQRADPVYFFDYENFGILPIGPSQETLQYFHDHYFDKALNIDSDFLHGQLTYLEKELSESRPIRRVTKSIKERVLRHYCQIHGLDIDDVEGGFSKKQLNSMCKAFIDVENDFREKYRQSIEKRIQWLEQADDRLDNI